MARAVEVVGFDHVVLNVGDVERSLAFYCGVLGMAPVRVDAWRSGTAPFPSARADRATIIDLLAAERGAAPANVDHICLVIAPTDLDALRDSGDFDVVDGPATRFGARGEGRSLYVRDPDSNVVELRYYASEPSATRAAVTDSATRTTPTAE